MATLSRHRKLFPAPTDTNQTNDCHGFCDPACPDNCYSDYYFLTPPPPPQLSSQEHAMSPFLIVAVIIIASLILVVCYYLLVVRSYSGWCGSRYDRESQAQEENAEEEFLDENQVQHPIWFITTTGLQQSVINSITIFQYRKGDRLIESTECSVCLSEFREDETLRLLPKCNHAFHISCIDTWLRSHTNCPMCRAHIVTDPVVTPLVSGNQNSENLNAANIGTQTENNNDQISSELSDVEQRNEHREVTVGSEESTDIPLHDGARIPKRDANFIHENGDFQVLSDSGVEENYIQLMTRSFSMDSLTSTTLLRELYNYHSPIKLEETLVDQTETAEKTSSVIDPKQHVRPASLVRSLARYPIRQCLRTSPVSMKRSFSCGGRVFPSRQNRNRIWVLPH